MGERVTKKGEPACYDKSSHHPATQTHQDRAEEDHPDGFVRQGEEAMAPFEYGVALGTDLLALQGEGAKEKNDPGNANTPCKRRSWQ